MKGTRLLNRAIYRMTQKQGWFLLLAEAAVQLVLGMMLLFHHEQKITMHLSFWELSCCAAPSGNGGRRAAEDAKGRELQSRGPCSGEGAGRCAQQELQEGALASDAL